MRNLAIVLTLALLASCASTDPVRTVDGTYMVSNRVALGGEAGALNAAIDHAGNFCAKQNKTVTLVTQTVRECALRGGCGEAQITFRCEATAP